MLAMKVRIWFNYIVIFQDIMGLVAELELKMRAQAAEERERSSRRLRDAEDAAKAAEAKANQTYNEDITRLKEAHLQVR